MTITITAIITTSVLAHALSNQVFAQAGGHGGWLVGHSGLLGQILAGHEAQIRKQFPGLCMDITPHHDGCFRP